jgi:hypothetical protein
MGAVYVLKADGRSEAMKAVLCKDEDRDLQTLLKHNFDLLPGDQIDPEAPCRWMLIRREMPVPDPSTGTNRWNIDYMFVDQVATPTFVECKRYLDTRSRREVVGQVLEYAANGQHYWRAADIRSQAEATAKQLGTTIEETLQRLQSDLAESPDAFFAEVERRLKSGEVRIIFFLEQAPPELKRLVEFLNREMNSVEVLLVEARQYSSNGLSVVVPTLFGFSEQIRELKRAAATERGQKPIASDWESFRRNAEQKRIGEDTIAAMRKVYDACKELQADIAWGRGTVTGSFSPKWPSVASTGSLISLYADGRLEMHFPQFQATEVATAFSNTFAAKLNEAGLPLPADYRTTWPSFSADKWTAKADAVIDGLKQGLTAPV